MEFLKADLQHLFDSQGVDQSQYDDKVDFMDPITKYNSVKGSLPTSQATLSIECSCSKHALLSSPAHNWH